jgi:hypothetical protein
LAEQRAPGLFTGVHTPALHQCAAAQSLAPTHVPAHAAAPHRNGAQACTCTAGHAPAPSQVAASVATPSVHAAARQLLVGYWHSMSDEPSHAPAQAVPVPAQA